MPLLSWLLGKRDANKGNAGAGKSQLVWFELQVCPFEFRLAVIPGQPVLIGFAGSGQQQGETTLMPYDRNRGAVNALVNALDAAIGKSDIFSTPPHAAEQAFVEAAMQMASLHFRAAYSDNRRWAAVYLLDEMPGNIRALLDESHRLAKQTLMQNATAPVAPATAIAMVAENKNSAAPPEIAALEAAVKAKVKVMHSGQVFLNGQAADLVSVRQALSQLKQDGGVIWYHREPPNNPADEPPHAAMEIIKAVVELQLPIKLCEEDFD